MLSIVVPSHREPNIHEFIALVEQNIPAYEVVVASDRYGRGKGWALREAFNEARGKEIVFLDGDGDIHPRMILRLLPFLDDFDAVVGTKRICHKSFKRRVVTYLSRFYIRVLFGLDFDTQTGIKIFRKDMIEPWKSDGFLCDIEILYKIKKNGGRVIEVPIEAEIKAGLSWRVLWRTLIESVILRCRL